ncbi:MFS transporter [Cupriavidus sp. 2TAF22]|uniref:MFS transporter n=1 Tax=unclassified Cupriavidus TaxID=2640874 RepID=UPI003F8F6A90
MRAVVFCAVQFLLAVTWTLYLAFLPQLAAQAGIAKQHIAWILLMDQAIFVATDCALGIAADRVANAMRHLGGWILALSVASGAAFVLLPRTTSPILLIGLTALWAATSSALRAPPMVIIARRTHRSAAPFLVACSLLGLGVAAALAPMLTIWMRHVSPTLPFAVASAGLVAAVMALRWLDHLPEPGAADRQGAPGEKIRAAWLFFAAVWSLALGFQVHTAVNSAPAYMRFAPAADLARFMPAFWIGFAVCVLLPRAAVFRRCPAHVLLLAATALGALALCGFTAAPSLAWVLVMQCAAGGLWGVIFGTAANAALDAGRVGREGRFTGLVFALSALAAFMRIAMMAAGAGRHPDVAAVLPWLPPLAWGIAAMLLALFFAGNLAYFNGQARLAGNVPGAG